MRRLSRFLPAVLFLSVSGLAGADVHYTMTPEPDRGVIAVTVSDDEPDAIVDYKIPAWCPGFYFIEKFQEKIEQVTATDASGSNLRVEHTEAHTWEIINPDRKIATLHYLVKADDPGLGFFGDNVRPDKAFSNGAATFMYRQDALTEPVSLQINVPAGWDIATGMTRVAGNSFRADGYDEFIDHPIQMGAMKRTQFKVGDYQFDVAWVAADNKIYPKLVEQTEVLRKESAQEIGLFRGAPFKRYQYILHLTSAGFLGGLEHRASTCIAMPNTGQLDLSTLAGHEFFHTWNVKNIRPAVLGPFDYTKEARTGNLWFAEGVTDYYSYLETYRCGLDDVAWLYGVLSDQVSQLQDSPTRLKVTLEDACKRTWESGGFGFQDLDYYNKGLLAGLLFDADIRGSTQGAKSLDDVMRAMYAKYRLPNPGYPEDGIRQMINQVSGHDLSSTYVQMIRSTSEAPYAVLAGIGLRAVAPNSSFADPGFRTLDNKVSFVTSSASDAGLKAGDLVVGTVPAGKDLLKVEINRDGKPLSLNLPLKNTAIARWQVIEDPAATAQQRKNLAGWLLRSP